MLLTGGDEPGALVALRAYLRGHDLQPATRADAERHVIALQRRLGEVEIMCDVDGALITVDGQPRGRTPLKSGIVLRPGTHWFEVAKPGYAPARKQFTLAAGERKPFRFSLPR